MTRLIALLCCLSLAACGNTADPADGGGTNDAGTISDAGEEPDGGETGTTAIGDACEESAECAGDGASCLTYLPGGYCVTSGCEPGTCGDGARCVPSAGGESFCAKRCETNADCRDGWECQAPGICWWPHYVPVNPGASPVGAACDDADDCETGGCVAETTSSGDPTGYEDGYCTIDCHDANDCPDDSICRRGLCRAACTATCRDGYQCVDGACMRDGSSVPIGAACVKDSDCGWGTCIIEELNAPGFPGGYCTVTDDCSMVDGAGCGSDGDCFSTGDAFGDVRYCLDLCDSDDDCREGYACDDSMGVKWCLVAYSSDVANAKLGEPCTTNEQCGTGYCLTADHWTNGYCSLPGCVQADVGVQDSCTSGGGQCVILGDAPLLFCLKACSKDSDCRTEDGFECHPDGFCAPAQ